MSEFINCKDVIIVGAGLGNQILLTNTALDSIKNAQLVITTDRLFEKFSNLNPNSIKCALSQINDIIDNSEFNNIVVLASGDIGFFSLSTSLKNSMQHHKLRFINGISSLQYLAAKLLIPYDNIVNVSVHGRDCLVVPYVCYNHNVFVLTGGKYKASDVINQLVEAGLGFVTVTIGEKLSDPDERILSGTASSLTNTTFDNLSVMLIQNDNCQNCHRTLCDLDFYRCEEHTVPMTKEDIRNLSIAKLDIQPTDTVYDIGAGTGSVSIAMAYKAREGTVYAIEKNKSAITMLQKNRLKHGAFNCNIIAGIAPDSLKNLPTPNKVFIGGSGKNLNSIISTVLKANEIVLNTCKIHIVVTAVTLETLTESVQCFLQHSITPEITCVNISNSQKLGEYTMLNAQNPVYIIIGEKQYDK